MANRLPRMPSSSGKYSAFVVNHNKYWEVLCRVSIAEYALHGKINGLPEIRCLLTKVAGKTNATHPWYKWIHEKEIYVRKMLIALRF